tara:strand:+ start:3744 stop:3884 length:141 start_codon:yes stop_codon:yes gene_type:complete
MSFKKDPIFEENSKKNNINKKNNKDTVERFLSILWRREVDWKLTFK